jgi:WD40 repeat protein
LEFLRVPRGLLVLDNLEAILEPGCLLLTSREQPIRADEVTVCALRLEGLSVAEGRVLLGSLVGSRLSEAMPAEAFSYPLSVALSSDGAHLAVGTSTGEVCLWRISDRTQLPAVQGHTGAVRRVALSEDGRLVASGSQDGTVRLWEATPTSGATGRLPATLQGNTGGVQGVALSGDGRIAAGGGWDTMIRLWDVPSGQLPATLQGHTRAVWGVALSKDGRLPAGGSYDGTAKLWETNSGACLRTLLDDYERMDITGLSGGT